MNADFAQVDLRLKPRGGTDFVQIGDITSQKGLTPARRSASPVTSFLSAMLGQFLISALNTTGLSLFLRTAFGFGFIFVVLIKIVIIEIFFIKALQTEMEKQSPDPNVIKEHASGLYHELKGAESEHKGVKSKRHVPELTEPPVN